MSTRTTSTRRLALVLGVLVTVIATAFAGTAGAAPKEKGAGGAGGAGAISNDLVEIEPAKVRGAWSDDASGRSGRMVAKFVPTEFVDDGGALAVAGTVSGVMTGKLPAGTPRHFTEEVVLPVTGAASDAPTASSTAYATPAAAAACDILSLDLGPLALDLLGLQVDLAPVVLDIVAQAGAGNLLGNLLCAVAGLLDGGALGGLLDGIIDALNGLLQGLLDLDGLLEELGGVLTGVAQTRSA